MLSAVGTGQSVPRQKHAGQTWNTTTADQPRPYHGRLPEDKRKLIDLAVTQVLCQHLKHRNRHVSWASGT